LYIVPAGARDIFNSIASRPVSGTLSPAVLPPQVNRPGSKVDHSPLSNVHVNNCEVISPLPIHLYGVVLNKLKIGTPLSIHFTPYIVK
jgi:hypothetical protein